MLLTAFLFFLSGIVGCQFKTEADYVQDVVNSIAVYKADLKSRIQEIDASSGGSEDNPIKAMENIKVASKEFVQYSNKLNQLNLSSCPADFRQSVENYAKKVETFTKALDQMFSEDSGLIGMFAIASQMENITKEVDNAEQAMIQLAKDKYGASVSIDTTGL